jgi:hypothetical protein
MHSSLDQLASDAEGDEIFVHAHIYRHTPTANLFHKAFTQFEGGGFDLCVQLSSLHGQCVEKSTLNTAAKDFKDSTLGS